MAAGGSAQEQAAGAQAAVDRLVRKQEYAARRAAAFAAGAEGERIAASHLAVLSPRGYVLLHDRLLEDGGNLDHVVAGPTGVWLVNAKHWSGAVTVEAGALRQNGRSRVKHVQRAVAEAEAVSAVLEAAGLAEAPVTPVLAFTASAPAGSFSVQGVAIVGVEDLAGVIMDGSGGLPSRLADRAVGALTEVFPPADDAAHPVAEAGGSGAAVPKGLDDPARYLFVEPWRSRGGKRRLYVKAVDRQLGWVDPEAGTVKAEVDGSGSRAALELIAREFTDTDDDDPKPPSLLRRFARWYLDVEEPAQYVVAVRWRRSGRDRLYVHLTKRGGERQQLGYVDRVTGRVHPGSKEFAGVLMRAAELCPLRSGN